MVSDARRRERNHRSTKSRKLWARVYKSRMRARLEPCRAPGCPSPADVLGHIVPFCKGGKMSPDNLSCLCRPCDREQGEEIWDWLPSLRDDPEFERKMGLGVVS